MLLRLFGPFLPGDYQTVAFSVPVESLGFQNRPYSAGFKHTSEFSTHVRVNSKRLRGPEIDYVKPPKTFRALVLGDSFTLALQVEEAETFVNRLGAYLMESSTSGTAVESINGGADGWSTVNEYLWFTTEGYRYDPDLLVLMYFDGNDPGENSDRIVALEPDGQIVPRQVEPVPLADLRLALSERSVAWNLLEFGMLAKLSPRTPAPAGSRAPDTRDLGDDRKERGWVLSESLLTQLRDECVRRGIALVVVNIPTESEVSGKDTPSSGITVIGERIGVTTIDLLDTFRARDSQTRRTLYFPINRHWTALGHELAAQTVVGELIQRQLVPLR